jgi:hypothetical protein
MQRFNIPAFVIIRLTGHIDISRPPAAPHYTAAIMCIDFVDHPARRRRRRVPARLVVITPDPTRVLDLRRRRRGAAREQ